MIQNVVKPIALKRRTHKKKEIKSATIPKIKTGYDLIHLSIIKTEHVTISIRENKVIRPDRYYTFLIHS